MHLRYPSRARCSNSFIHEAVCLRADASSFMICLHALTRSYFFIFLEFDWSIFFQKNPSVASINFDSTRIFILLYTNYSTKFKFYDGRRFWINWKIQVKFSVEAYNCLDMNCNFRRMYFPILLEFTIPK